MLVAIVLLATFMNKDDGHTDYKEVIRMKDEIIKEITKDRDEMRKIHESAIMEIHVKDSLLRLKYKTIVIQNEKIPVYVAGLSDSALRSAIESYR